MSDFPRLILASGKEKPVLARHHWIFSGAVKNCEPHKAGDILSVQSAGGQHLGYAYASHGGSIAARMISFDKTLPEKTIQDRILQAVLMRRALFSDATTNCWRVIQGEWDGIPGLVVDRYDDVLVIQVSTVGVDRLKAQIVAELVRAFSPRAIYEHSNLPSRRKEGMKDHTEVLHGIMPEYTDIRENGVVFRIHWKEVQKTGFFLDQREMRSLIGSFAKDRRVLNCFSYTGGFSAYAAVHGAKRVDSVDIAQGAIDLAQTNFSLNGINPENHGFYGEDVFQFLRDKPLSYEVIILDPPAFAKKKDDVEKAARGYKDINWVALKKALPGSFLLTCSCSYFMEPELFQMVVFQAARDAGRNVRIIHRHRLAFDHPINIYHPEGDYLKSLFLYVE